jgi:hypothetical protein
MHGHAHSTTLSENGGKTAPKTMVLVTLKEQNICISDSW